jgi:hypothetical protein
MGRERVCKSLSCILVSLRDRPVQVVGEFLE